MHTITFDSHVPPDSKHGRKQRFLVLDGEPLTDALVSFPHRFPGVPEQLPFLLVGYGYSSSLISKLPVGEVLAKFQWVEVWFTPDILEDHPDIEDHIERVSLLRSLPKDDSSEDVNVLDPKLIFPVTVDEENWAKPFSIVQFYDALGQVVSKHPTYRSKFDQDDVHRRSIRQFYIDIKDQQASINDLVEAHRLSLQDIILQTYAMLAAAVRRDSLVAFFEFPPAFKTACQQYLVYFIQFLSDMGIEADAELKEESHRVLFAVTPRTGQEGLERIRDALDAYLRLPDAPDMAGLVARYPDTAVAQLYANVLHLQSQVVLAKSALQMKDATIESLQLSNFQYRQLLLIQDKATGEYPSIKESSTDQESVLGGFIKVKPYESKGIVLDLPRILRSLKRRISRNQ
jgi:hypothetical protein